MYLTILKYVLVFAVAWFAYEWIYDRGYRQCELVRAEQDLQNEMQIKAKYQRKVELEKLARYEAERNLIGALENETKRNEELQRDIDAIHGKRMYVTVKEPRACGDRTGLSEDKDSSSPDEEARAELSDETAARLTRYGADVEQRMNQLTTLIEILEANKGKCLEVVGGK